MNITLTTTGRRTGVPRTLPLYAWPDGDRLVIVGSKGGAATNPAWVHNLRAEPRVTVKESRDTQDYCATEVEVAGEERDRLWTLVTEAFPMYAGYQRKSQRLIPLFILEPVDAA